MELMSQFPIPYAKPRKYQSVRILCPALPFHDLSARNLYRDDRLSKEDREGLAVKIQPSRPACRYCAGTGVISV